MVTVLQIKAIASSRGCELSNLVNPYLPNMHTPHVLLVISTTVTASLPNTHAPLFIGYLMQVASCTPSYFYTYKCCLFTELSLCMYLFVLRLPDY